jgi:uncharacterized membrane protein YeaQ/YmgE (transglycosylase-associated protein family)
MEFTIDMGLGAWVLVIAAAIVFGVAAQLIGETRTGFEWLIDAIAFGIGAVVASELIVALQTFEPVWEGLAIVPALVGGLVLGILVEVVTRLVTGGTYVHRPLSP